jgi:hypothetical protein
MSFKNFGASPTEKRDVKMADLGARAKFGSSWKILENRYGVQIYIIIFSI